VAYRQPITRSEIEEIRGVSISSTIMRTLQERGWIRTVGHREVPGRPELLGTTREFLDYFGLRSLEQLPTLAELKDVENIGVQLELPAGEGAPDAGDGPAQPTDEAANDAAAAESAEAASPEDVVMTAASNQDVLDDVAAQAGDAGVEAPQELAGDDDS